MRYFALIIALMFSACVFDTAYAQTARKTFRIGPKTDDDKELKFNRDSTTPPGILWAKIVTGKHTSTEHQRNY